MVVWLKSYTIINKLFCFFLVLLFCFGGEGDARGISGVSYPLLQYTAICSDFQVPILKRAHQLECVNQNQIVINLSTKTQINWNQLKNKNNGDKNIKHDLKKKYYTSLLTSQCCRKLSFRQNYTKNNFFNLIW